MNRDDDDAPPPASAEDAPKWKRDFPIDASDDQYVSRRDLVKFLVLTSAAFAAGQGTIVAQSLLRRDREPLARKAVATTDELQVGGGMVFQYPEGSSPRILVRVSEETFAAYDQACTHLMCPVLPEPKEGKLHCPCHNGWFDVENGRPLAGPPERPLPKIHLSVEDGVIYATGVELRAT